jgi:hypothetical protein
LVFAGRGWSGLVLWRLLVGRRGVAICSREASESLKTKTWVGERMHFSVKRSPSQHLRPQSTSYEVEDTLCISRARLGEPFLPTFISIRRSSAGSRHFTGLRVAAMQRVLSPNDFKVCMNMQVGPEPVEMCMGRIDMTEIEWSLSAPPHPHRARIGHQGAPTAVGALLNTHSKRPGLPVLRTATCGGMSVRHIAIQFREK